MLVRRSDTFGIRALIGAFSCAVLVALLVPTSPLGAQGTFEGMVAYKMQGMPGEMRYFQQGKKVRQEMQIEGMAGPVTIFDGTTGTAVVLMPMQKQYMKMGAGGADDEMTQAMLAQHATPSDAPDFAAMKVRATGRRETVAGIECEHYVFESTVEQGSAKIDICGATGMGFMGSVGPMGNPMSTAALLSLGGKSSQMAKLAKQGFFPLKMTMSVAGAPAMTWEVTRVEKKKLAASLFAVPAGYKELEMPGMPRTAPPRRAAP